MLPVYSVGAISIYPLAGIVPVIVVTRLLCVPVEVFFASLHPSTVMFEFVGLYISTNSSSAVAPAIWTSEITTWVEGAA